MAAVKKISNPVTMEALHRARLAQRELATSKEVTDGFSGFRGLGFRGFRVLGVQEFRV